MVEARLVLDPAQALDTDIFEAVELIAQYLESTEDDDEMNRIEAAPVQT